MVDLQSLKDDIILTGQELRRLGCVSATDGNLSARLDEDHIIITASGARKGYLKPEDLLVCNLKGQLEETSRRVSSEIFLHLTAYRLRPDIGAVIHAHPPLTVSCSLAGIRLDEPILPSVWMTVGAAPTASYAPPASPLGAKAIESLIPDFNAIILDRHGIVTVGVDLTEALNRLERVEFLAGAVLRAKAAGKIRSLSPQELALAGEAGERLV